MNLDVQNSTFAATVGGAASMLLVDGAGWVASLITHTTSAIPVTDAQAFTVLVMALLAHYVPDASKPVELPSLTPTVAPPQA